MQPPTKPESDSEDDGDYVPPAHDTDDDEPISKRARTRSPTPEETLEAKEQNRKAQQDLFEKFKAEASSSKTHPDTKLVEVVKKYRFAGDEVTEVIQVPEDSEDAQKWPRCSNASSEPRPSKPAPRKPKTKLLSQSSQKLKKLSTLDKSAMDWNSHLASESASVKDELTANRRGGGYLEKVDFLQRVEDRKEEVLDASKGTKRRR